MRVFRDGFFGLAALLAVSSLLTRGVQFVCFLFFARFLSITDFGALGFAQTTVLLVTTFFALNAGQIATQMISKAGNNVDEVQSALLTIFVFCFLFSLFCGGVLYAFRNQFSILLVGNEFHASVFVTSSITVFFSIFVVVQNGVILGLNIVKSSVIGGFFSAPVVLLIGYFSAKTGDLSIALWSLAVAQIITFSIQQMLIFAKIRNIGIKFRGLCAAKIDRNVISGYGLTSTLAGLLTVPPLWLALAMLSKSSAGLVGVAEFNFASQIRAIVFFGIGVIAAAALPRLTRLHASKNFLDFLKFKRQVTFTLTAFVFILVCVVGFWGKSLLGYFMPTMSNAYDSVMVLLFSSVFVAGISMDMRASIARGTAKSILGANSCFAIILVFGAMVFYREGPFAISLVVLVATVIQFLFLKIYEWKIVRAVEFSDD